MNVNDLVVFAKAGTAITDANGVAWVTFREPFDYGIDYSVFLTCVDPGQAVIAYPSNITQTGFTIVTKDTRVGGGGYAPIAAVTVHWLAIPSFNG